MKFLVKPLTGFLALTLILVFAPLAHAKARSLISIKVDNPPVLDGEGKDAAWKKVKPAVVEAEDGPKISVKTVHTKDRVYFLLSWKDETESINMDKWVYDGNKWSIKQEKRWEDEPPWEADSDRFCFQWPIRDEVLIKKFAKKGCAVLCHKPEKENKMYTSGPNQASDIWQWRASITNPLGYADDGFLNNTNISKKDEKNAVKRINAAHQWDALGPGGINFVRNKEGGGPRWMSRTHPDGPFLIKGKEVPLNMSKVKKGDAIPGYLLTRPNGSRGDISAAARHDKDKGQWTLELSRNLVTNDKAHDVQFDDLSKTYYFGIAVWENDRLYGHTRVKKPFALTFK
ncbi:MAG: ethylbenzene dehydrogenase-related protein [Nitrospinaceae bacterium]